MFRGSIVALVTPMKGDSVDIEALRGLVDFHINAGTHAIVTAGSTGESSVLSHNEKLLVIKTVIDEVKERVPVIAGTAMNSTRDCIDLTREAMTLGAHAALIMSPSSIKPTQEGLFLHYSHIAESVPMPIILYNNPFRTASDMLPETVARLAKISNIIGIKESVNQMTRLMQIRRLCEDHIDVYSGDDPTGAAWLLAGAKAIISVTANVAPKLMAKQCEAGLDGDQALCLKIHEKLSPLHEALGAESNPIPVKWLLNQMGLIGPDLRMPLTSLSSEYHAALNTAFHALDDVVV